MTSACPSESTVQPFGYVPALDGLRGVAIMIVMVYHAFPATLHGGFLGVELFFVLSGFLITALLLKEWDRYGSISLPAFYMRRVIRLLPALVVLLTGILLVDGVWFGNDTIVRDGAFSLGYIMNWARAFGWVETSVLAHTWSLSIEEQFYLLWPAIMIVLCRRMSPREIARLLAMSAALFAAYRFSLACSGASAIRLYNGLDTRADGLILGSALAAVMHVGWGQEMLGRSARRVMRTNALCTIGLLVAIGLASWGMWSTYTFYLPLTVLCSTGLIAGVYCSPNESTIRRILESGVLVGIGRISYGLYLWHYPVYRILGREGWSPVPTAVLGTVLTFTAAMASWTLVEQPLLRLKGRFSPAAARRSARETGVISG